MDEKVTAMAQGHKTGGRVAGTPNKVTTMFKDAVRTVYEDIGGHQAFAAWARENPGDFYRIASRLIPTEIAATGDSLNRSVTVQLSFVKPLNQSIDHPLALTYEH